MKAILKRVASLALAALMLLTLIPAGLAEGTSVPVIPGLSDGGSLAEFVLTQADEPDQETVTVSFDIGDDAQNAGVAIPDALTVDKGGTLTLDELPSPVWQDAAGQPVKVFDGWYTDEGLENEFNVNDEITQSMTLHAKWVGMGQDGLYYVNFYSQDGATVCRTVAVDEGETVSAAPAPVEAGKVFVGWSMTRQEDSPASALEPFNFRMPISQAASGDEHTLNLYAWYGDEVKVSFIANGGTAVPTQILASGQTATEPETTRTGYTFHGWSTKSDEFDEFNFDNRITADITLYAFWDANMVPVRLVYMYENADDDEYSAAGLSQTVYAPAGSYISIVRNNNIKDTGERHNVRYSLTDGGEPTGNAKDGSGQQARNATIPDVSQTYYQYASSTDNRYVMPDGTTVVLVYYDRVRVTLTFEYGLDYNGSINIDDKISREDQEKYNVEYEQETKGLWNKYTNFTYSFTAKYGQNIVPVWPQVAWVESGSDRWGNTFYGWDTPDDSIQVSNVFTLEEEFFNSPYIDDDGKLVAVGNLPAVEEETNRYWLIYARTTLPGEDADFTYNGQDYTIYEDACQLAFGATWFGYKPLDGCEPIGGNNSNNYQFGATYSELGNNDYRLDNINRWPGGSITATGDTVKEKFERIFGDQIRNNDRCQVLLYDRGTVRLSLFVNDVTYGANAKTQDYLYGDWIYNDEAGTQNADLLKTVEANMKKEGFIFAGWYTTNEYTPGTEYVLTEESRIQGNLNLYAKWEPNQFLAEYYLYLDDLEPYDTQGFAEGGHIDNKIVPVAVQDIFEGWYWYQDGKLVPFDFSAAVGQNHVDKYGKLKLYAQWEGTEGKVSYLPGIGGDNDTQEVTDERNFEINSASVMLKDYTEVWPNDDVPTPDGLTFVGWKAPNGAIYQPGRYVLVTRHLMQFEAQWSRDAVTLIYNANDGVGDDVTETWARHSSVDIWDNMNLDEPHFTREGYELIGWDEDKDATDPTYRLGEGTIELNKNETTLYAIWRRSAVDVVIKKQVTGNMGDREQEFAIIVSSDKAISEGEGYKLTPAGEVTNASFALSHEESVRLKGVPVGATLTITESHADDYEMRVSPANGNTTNMYTIPANAQGEVEITITNHKDAIPDTGILLDSLPYVLILAAVAGIGLVALMRRRRNRDDY